MVLRVRPLPALGVSDRSTLKVTGVQLSKTELSASGCCGLAKRTCVVAPDTSSRMKASTRPPSPGVVRGRPKTTSLGPGTARLADIGVGASPAVAPEIVDAAIPRVTQRGDALPDVAKREPRAQHEPYEPCRQSPPPVVVLTRPLPAVLASATQGVVGSGVIVVTSPSGCTKNVSRWSPLTNSWDASPV
jgi:hypothetical protein